MSLPTTKTPEGDALRAESAEHAAKREESFQRCDTDGFLSQWADGLHSNLAMRAAGIADAGGLGEFTGLYQGERRVRAKVISGNFGCSWLLHPSETALISARGRAFLPTGKTSRVLRSLGLTERPEVAPARAIITGQGTGLSGSAWVATVRAGDEWGSDAKAAS